MSKALPSIIYQNSAQQKKLVTQKKAENESPLPLASEQGDSSCQMHLDQTTMFLNYPVQQITVFRNKKKKKYSAPNSDKNQQKLTNHNYLPIYDCPMTPYYRENINNKNFLTFITTTCSFLQMGIARVKIFHGSLRIFVSFSLVSNCLPKPF